MRPTVMRVEETMTTVLFTVSPDEPLELAAWLMEWKRVRHIPVEDSASRWSPSCFEVLRELSRKTTGATDPGGNGRRRNDLDSVHGARGAPELEALALMRERHVDYLLVVTNERLWES